MKDDTIKRSDVIDAVKIILDRFGYREYSIGFKWAMSVIETLPSADRPQEWIPCSDRLPNAEYGESDTVLACRNDGLMELLYFDGGNWCYPTGEAYVHLDYNKVVAWMPLPKPWEGVDDEASD